MEKVAIRRILTINPTYATVMYRNVSGSSKLLEYKEDLKVEKRSRLQIENEKNLEKNQHLGDLSLKAYKRIKKSINWLEYIADERVNRKGVKYKVSMITLTIPSFSNSIEEKRLKKVLNQFLTYARLAYGLKSYVWKAELTKAGNLHYHLLTSEILGFADVKMKWNDLLLKEGLLDDYMLKFGSMSECDYKKLRFDQCEKYGNVYNESQVLQAYMYGCRTGWTQPRSVQIDEIPIADSLAGYLSKYISKSAKSEGGKDENVNILKGRIWGCSRNLSMSNKLSFKIEQDDSKYLQMLHDLTNVSRAYDDIVFKDERGFEKVVGYKLFFDVSIWDDMDENNLLKKEFDSFVHEMKAGRMYTNPQLQTQTEVNHIIKSKLEKRPFTPSKQTKSTIQHILF